MSPSISCQAKLNDASEVYRLSLLLTVCAAANQDDLRPTFTAGLDSEEGWLWREAKKLDSDSTVIDAATNILVLDSQILAGMAAGKCALLVLSDSSSDHDHEGADALRFGHCVMRPDGVDYWAKTKISGNGCSMFHLEKPITLSDHVRTLSAYLNDYRKTEGASERGKMSSLFAQYINAACWRSMYQRMTHWATLGLIKTLLGVSDDSMKLAAQNHPEVFDCKHDSRLANRLIVLAARQDDGSSILQTVMARYHPHQTAAEDQLSALLSKCREGGAPVLYTQDTLLNFHHLLVATLMVYRSLLARIHDAEDGSKKQNLGVALSMLTRLLSTILHSKALASHLRILYLDGLLPLPTSAAAEGYHNFAEIHGFGLANKDRRRKRYTAERDEAVVDVGMDVETNGGVIAETEPNMDEGDGTADGEDSHWESMEGVAAVLGWMKTFTSHHSAQRLLEHHCYRSQMEEVQITLFAVGSEYRKVSWEDMKLTIATTLDTMAKNEGPSIPTEETIKILEAEIQAAKPTDKHGKNVFGMFKQMISGNVVRCLCRVHCGAALAAFSVYGDSSVPVAEEADRQKLKDLLQNLDLDTVAVSKVCCPICWVFLQLLRKEKLRAFNVRGHHSTLYPVDLPGWLPDSLLQDMITELQGRLGQQLKIMAFPRPAFKKHSWPRPMERDPLSDTSAASYDEIPREKLELAIQTMQEALLKRHEA